MTMLHDPPTGGKDPNSPGMLHALTTKQRLGNCAWCHEAKARTRFGWQHAGSDVIKWDDHWFCCVDHYRKFHGGERPTGA